jgi:hypothetical protein
LVCWEYGDRVHRDPVFEVDDQDHLLLVEDVENS